MGTQKQTWHVGGEREKGKTQRLCQSERTMLGTPRWFHEQHCLPLSFFLSRTFSGCFFLPLSKDGSVLVSYKVGHEYEKERGEDAH